MNANDTNKKIRKFLPFLILFVLIAPAFVHASIIPCDGSAQSPCDYNQLIQLAKNLIDWVIMISAPIAAGVFAWAGILYMTTGVADKKSQAKEMLKKVFIGFVLILGAWLIVTTITNTFLSNPSIVPLK